MTLPDKLTISRIILTFVFMFFLFVSGIGAKVTALFIFLIASFTDFLDGFIAKGRNISTNFGKLMDPIADKLLILAALLSLVSLGRVQAWVAMVIIAREFAVTATRMAVSQQGIVIAANWWGKAKTIVQVGVIFLLIAVNGTPPWLDVLVYVMVAITVVSGVDYFFGLRRLLREAEEAHAGKLASRTTESPEG